jgi:MoaD family protein
MARNGPRSLRCSTDGSVAVAAPVSTLRGMATLRLFAAAREAAGTGRAEVPGGTVDDVLTVAVGRYGAAFEQVLASCKVWVNGDEAGRSTPVGDGDEVAVLPPVSGGS